MKKLRLIIQREFIAKVRNKSFIIMTFLSPLIMIGMGALIVFLTKKNDSKVKEILYVDDSGLFKKEDFKDSETVKYLSFSDLGLEETKKKVEDGKHYGVLHVPKLDSLELLSKSVAFFSKDTPGLNTMENIETNIDQKLSSLKMLQLGIDKQKIRSSRIRSDIKSVSYTHLTLPTIYSV